MKVIPISLCCNNLWKSNFMAMENSEYFSPTLWSACFSVFCCFAVRRQSLDILTFVRSTSRCITSSSTMHQFGPLNEVNICESLSPTQTSSYPFDAHCCHTGTAIKHPVPYL